MRTRRFVSEVGELDLRALIDAVRGFDSDGVSVTDWSVYGSESRRLSLGVKDRETANAHAPLTIAESLGARYVLVWSDGRVSRGYLERRQLEADVALSLLAARAAAYDDPDAAQVAGASEFPDVPLHSPEVADLASGKPGPFAERLERIRAMVGRRGFRTWSASFSASETRACTQSSAGLDAEGHGTGTGWFVSVNGEIGTGFQGRAFEDTARFEARLEHLAELADELQRDAEPVAGGSMPVLLHPKVVESYVLSTLLHHLDGSTVSHGEGRFPRDEFGSDRPALREDLGLRVDPLTPMKSGAYRFTVEGVPASRASFISKGRLIQPVLDLKYARRLGLSPTPLPYSMDTLYLEGDAPLDLDGAYAEAQCGALVLSVLGVHTQDSASGDFSLSAPQVLRIADGGLAGRMRGTISGNLFEILRAPDLRFVRFPEEHTPGLMFRGRLDPK